MSEYGNDYGFIGSLTGLQMQSVGPTEYFAFVWDMPTVGWPQMTMHGAIPKVGERYALEVTKVEDKAGQTAVTFQFRKIIGAAP